MSESTAVLIIDDNDDSRESLQALLEQRGFSVIAARNGMHAMLLLHGGLRPGLIILDLVMPVMNGFEFREAQLRDPGLSHIPVIAFSAVTSVARNAQHLQLAAHFEKPTEPELVVAMVQQHCLKPPAHSAS